MKRLLLVLAIAWCASIASRADTPLFTADELNTFDQYGYLTPAFKTAAREMIDSKQAQRDAQADEVRLKATIPDLEKKAGAEEAKIDGLKKELSLYDHPDETDFTDLQAVMKDAKAKPEDQLALAQAYVWTYPDSPHQTEAQQDLAQAQKKIADAALAQKQSEAAQVAAHAELLQRVAEKKLSLEEWRVFLQDKSQTEVIQYLGHPNDTTDDYWTYSGAWTTDPTTQLKAGLQLTFNGGRVQNVAPIPVK